MGQNISSSEQIKWDLGLSHRCSPLRGVLGAASSQYSQCWGMGTPGPGPGIYWRKVISTTTSRGILPRLCHSGAIIITNRSTFLEAFMYLPKTVNFVSLLNENSSTRSDWLSLKLVRLLQEKTIHEIQGWRPSCSLSSWLWRDFTFHLLPWLDLSFWVW